MPGTTEPDVGDVDTLMGTDNVVLEHIAPLCFGCMPGSHDIAARRTVDLDGVTIQIDVTAVVDKVYGTLDERVLDIVAVLLVAGSNPGVLIRE